MELVMIIVLLSYLHKTIMTYILVRLSEMKVITQEDNANLLRNGFTSHCNIDVSDVKKTVSN